MRPEWWTERQCFCRRCRFQCELFLIILRVFVCTTLIYMICVCRYARVVHSLLYASCRIGVFVVDAYRFTSLFIISILVKWRRWTRSKEKNIDDGVTFHWESKMSNYFDKHIQPTAQFGWSSLINWAYNGLDLLEICMGNLKKTTETYCEMSNLFFF